MELAEFFVTHVQWALPTWLIRLMVRTMLRLVGWQMRRADAVCRQIRCDRHERRTAPVTTDTDKANEQHYGNDPRFFEAHLGPCLKYSACEWPDGTKDLAEAEVATLHIYQERARLSDLPAGSRVLELGCGWGSLTLANATRFPDLHFTAFSNSPQQVAFITGQARAAGHARSPARWQRPRGLRDRHQRQRLPPAVSGALAPCARALLRLRPRLGGVLPLF